MAGRGGCARWTTSALALSALIAVPSGTLSAYDEPGVTIEITASRFEYRPAVIEVRKGQQVRLVLHSIDVKHGFEIRDLGIELIIPKGGDEVQVEFVAREAGRFNFNCSEYCGAGHRRMRGELIVREADESVEALRLAQGAVVDAYELDPAEPDFTVINLPTTLRLPKHALGFWVTHRFARPLGRGDFGDLAGDLFGLDGGAQIGLGLRFGLLSGSQITLYRVSDRTIQLGWNQRVVSQDTSPVSAALVFSIEGRDNFSESYSPSLTTILSRRLGEWGALYLAPAWVGNTDLREDRDESTLLLGVGARAGLGKGVALVAEWYPRLAGFEGRDEGSTPDIVSLGMEKRVGGHAFQLNFSKDLGTTPAELARGQVGPDDWFIGFNITRKFY